MVCSPRLLYKLVFIQMTISPRHEDDLLWGLHLSGNEIDCVVILSDIYLIFWMLLLFSSSSIFTEAQALGCVWAGGIVLHSVWGLRGKRHRPKGL